MKPMTLRALLAQAEMAEYHVRVLLDLAEGMESAGHTVRPEEVKIALAVVQRNRKRVENRLDIAESRERMGVGA